MRSSFRQNTFYLITIRHPLSLYSSLYRYGLDGRGGVFHRLDRANLLNVYSDFDVFLRFVLNPKNAQVLGDGYTPEISRHIGIMSFRFLKLSLRYPLQSINQFIDRKNSILRFIFGTSVVGLQEQFITHLEIKNENLKEELAHFALVRFPEYFDDSLTRSFLAESERVNASETGASQLDTYLSEQTMENLRMREQLLWSRYE